MEIHVAKSAGFCFGVERAVKTVYEWAEKAEGPLYTDGPIIHNETVVNDLIARGIRPLAPGEIPPPGSTVILRSHGVTKDREEELKAAGLTVVDATCPFVARIHRLAEEESAKGRQIVIIGDATHPEVEGILSHCPNGAAVIKEPEEAEALTFTADAKISVLAQTTSNRNKFDKIVEILEKTSYDVHVLNTICNATQVRQQEAEQIARYADGMIVVGGRNSSNSRKLFEICREVCRNTIFVGSVSELTAEWFSGINILGITAGASTPQIIIQEVQTYVRTEL